MKKTYLILCISVLMGIENTSIAQTTNLLWVKGMGGVGNDEGYSTAVDANGNVYTTGRFEGTVNFDPCTGIYNLTTAGSWDIFVSKQNSSGQLLWTKQMGGTSVEWGNSIAVDANGNVYTTGRFQGTADFDPGPGVFNLTSIGSNDIFVSKLDALGNFVWGKQFMGTADEAGQSVTVDVNGNIYTTGYFYQTVDFDPGPGTFNLTSSGSTDIFIAKLDPSGNFVWAKKLGGGDINESFAINVDLNGNIYTTGYFQSTADFDPGPATFNLTSIGSNDIFVSKLDALGNFVWAKQLGGIGGGGTGYSLTVGLNGDVYITGYFVFTIDFDPGPLTYNLSGTNADVFILKLDNSGNFNWAKKIGGTGFEIGYGIDLDNNENVYITGYFSNSVDFDPGPGTFNLSSSGSQDIFISKIDPSGNFVWAKKFGGTGTDYGYSIIVDPNGDINSTGKFQNIVDFDSGPGSYNLSSIGDYDVFAVKLGSGNTSAQNVFYRDADSDGYGNAAIRVGACTAPSGYVNNNTDCNDANNSIHPGAIEICNGVDDNCDGLIDGGILITPSVTISNNINSTIICSGVPVTFTASSTNIGGGIVTYNFKINGVNMQSGTLNTYTSNSLSNGDIITCEININGGTCLNNNVSISNSILMTVMPTFHPTLSLSSNPSGPICFGTPVNFTATVSNNASSTINYAFKVNGNTIQSSSSNTFSSSTLANSDVVTCTVNISHFSCQSPSNITSLPIVIISIVDSQSPLIICPPDTILNFGTDTSPASSGTASATDNCPGVNITYSDISTQTANGNGYTNYIITRTWKAIDATGNSATCNQIIRVCQMSVSLGSNKYVLYGALGYTGCGLLTPAITGGLAPFTYLWTSDDVFVNGLTTATAISCNTQDVVRSYSVVVTSANGCTATATVSLTFININCSNNNNTVKVKICHIPQGNPSNCNTICVSVNAVQTLLNSGSYLGECLPLCEVPPLGFAGNQNISDYIIKKETFVKKDEKMSKELFDVKVLNNPTESFFKLYLISNDLYKKVSLRLMDINGKVLEQIENLHVYQEIRIGDKFVSGVYFAEFVQGGSRKVVKLVKHN